MYNRLGGNYKFVSTCRPVPELMKGGEDYCHQRPYCINAWETQESTQLAYELAVSSDVCRFGGDSIEYAIHRAKNNPTGLSFEAGERWLKRGLINILSPHLIKWWWYYQTLFRKANFYYMCDSFFGARDLNLLGTYKNRCFNWGYFTVVNSDGLPAHSDNLGFLAHNVVRFMWCARFLDWKHPELPVLLAKRLKERGYKFVIDMYGTGRELERTERMVRKLNVDDVVLFKGSVPNSEILTAMQAHDIFLFTSDKNEGWGAVANEAMSNGCVLIASKDIGSAQLLIEDGVSGLLFNSCSIDSLTEKVEFLLERPELQYEMREKAYMQMQKVWNPKNAINNFLILIEDLLNNREVSIKNGPCSRA